MALIIKQNNYFNFLYLTWFFFILILPSNLVSTKNDYTVINKKIDDNVNRSCRSIFQRPASCVSLKDCTPFVNLLKELPSVGRRVIRASLCYSSYQPNNNLFLFLSVCCPGVRLFQESFNNKINSSNEKNKDNTSRPFTTISSFLDNNGVVDNSWKPLLEPPNCGFSDKPHNKVVGGSQSAVGAWPWLVALGYGISPKYVLFRCGGSLITSKHVLTAAHCVHGLNDLQIVRLGAYKLNSNEPDLATDPVDFLIEKKIVHPNFKLETLENDVAILRLAKSVKFTDEIQPICLPIADDLRNNTFVNNYPFIAGWGATSADGPTSSVIRETQVPVVENEKCKKNYSRVKDTVIDDRVLCAGYTEGGKDACQGDSGGGLFYPKSMYWYLIGIVSSGYSCAKPGFPGIYTRVTHYLDFIKSNLN